MYIKRGRGALEGGVVWLERGVSSRLRGVVRLKGAWFGLRGVACWHRPARGAAGPGRPERGCRGARRAGADAGRPGPGTAEPVAPALQRTAGWQR